MTDMIGRCGFKCHACLAFKGNNTTAADQSRVAEGWAKYFGLVVPPEKIRCNGCMAKDRGEYDFPDKNCPIAPCTIARGLDNCAGCSEYPCDKLEERMRACDEVKQRFRGAISHEEYERFIAPYDARTILNDVRKAKTLRR